MKGEKGTVEPERSATDGLHCPLMFAPDVVDDSSCSGGMNSGISRDAGLVPTARCWTPVDFGGSLV